MWLRFTETAGVTVQELQRLDPDGFEAAFGEVFEHSPWIARGAASSGPFDSVDAVHGAMTAELKRAPHEAQLALIRAHPDLADRLARPKDLTAHSHAEQAAAGLDSLTEHEAQGLARLNKHYKERFGFPFIICARKHDKASIIQAIEVRLMNDHEAEVEAALYEIGQIARLRLESIIH